MSKEDYWDEKTGRVHGNPLGFETLLGHSYSIILEEMAEQGLDGAPNPGEFLEYIKRNCKGEKAEEITLETPSYYPDYAGPIFYYMREKGLCLESCSHIMFEILGRKMPKFSKESD